MIHRLQKIFHTDKWWGKIILMLFFYLVFLFFGYWIWFLFSWIECLDCESYLMDLVSPVYFFVVLPVLSFILVYKIRDKFNLGIDKLILFIINLIIVLINLFLFILSAIFSISPNFF